MTPAALRDAVTSSDAVFADFDQDQDLDLYFAIVDGPNRLIRNDGSEFMDVTAGALADSGQCLDATWVDLDLDGDLDLHIVNRDGRDRTLENCGRGEFLAIEVEGLSDAGDGPGVAWGDLDGDGDLDLYVTGRGGNRLLENRLDSFPAPHWLQVDLAGRASNAMGVGARIRIRAGGMLQMQEVAIDSGDSPTTEFGLGTATRIDRLEVFWPSGRVSITTNVAADQRLEIDEEPTSPASAPIRNVLLQNAPNPFRPPTWLEFALEEEGAVRLVVFDVAGRAVRTLIDGRRGRGIWRVPWDGRDDEGMKAPAGVYAYRLEAVDGSWQSRKMTLLW